MDPNSGKIYDLDKINMNEGEARAKGLVPIPPDQEREVRGMNRQQRRAWAAQQRRAAK